MQIALWIAVVAVALLLAGFVYQGVAEWRDRRQHTRAGRYVTLGDGCRLYLREEGTGRPTVIFEAGIGASSLNWLPVQTAMAQETATLAYDRAGLGWSDPCRTERTPANVAAELHEMLQLAGVKPAVCPAGALVWRAGDAALCPALSRRSGRPGAGGPDALRGVAAVCAGKSETTSHCKRIVPECGALRALWTLAHWAELAVSGVGQAGGTAGALCRRELRARIAAGARRGGQNAGRGQPVIVALWSQPWFYRGMCAYLEGIPATVTEMDGAAPIRGIPVVVLTPGRSTPLSDEDLRRIGDQTRQVIAAKSEHWIHLDEPEVVIGAIREMVAGPGCARIYRNSKLSPKRHFPLEIRPIGLLPMGPPDVTRQRNLPEQSLL